MKTELYERRDCWWAVIASPLRWSNASFPLWLYTYINLFIVEIPTKCGFWGGQVLTKDVAFCQLLTMSPGVVSEPEILDSKTNHVVRGSGDLSEKQCRYKKLKNTCLFTTIQWLGEKPQANAEAMLRQRKRGNRKLSKNGSTYTLISQGLYRSINVCLNLDIP